MRDEKSGDAEWAGTVELKQLQFMVVPSLACPASCGYCFGPSRGPRMTRPRAEQILRLVEALDRRVGLEKLKITFHGGEPLAAGHDFFEFFLDGLAAAFPGRTTEFGLQSNLWLLDDAYVDLFRRHRVSIGTSLDGPEAINDSQRGVGYFRKTMTGLERARTQGLEVACIVTFTRASAPFWQKVLDFFIAEQLTISLHSAVPSLHDPQTAYALSPEKKAELYPNLIEYYIRNRWKITVSTFDQMARGIIDGRGHLCTFRDCLGMFLVVDPTGDIYPCQRFCGHRSHRLANLDDAPAVESLFIGPVAKRMRDYKRQAASLCRECRHWAYCRGGCVYNAWAGGNGSILDPFCPAYERTFSTLRDRLFLEMGSEENITAVAECSPVPGRHPLLRRGPLIELVRPGPHPREVARNAKRIVAAVELARGPDLAAVGRRLVEWGICRTPDTARASLEYLQRSLTPEHTPRNNLYLHLTFACQLRCAHCYAQAGTHPAVEMSLEGMEILVGQARRAGFRQVVVTGGEPLLHPARGLLLSRLRRLKPSLQLMNLVLRSNLALSLREDEMAEIAGAFHQVVVSVDGDSATHDARRGTGSYGAVVANLEKYQRLARTVPAAAELSIAAVLSTAQTVGDSGRSVRELADRLGVRRTRIRPLLPLGRAAGWDEPPRSEALGGHLDPLEFIENGFHPVAGCGLGQNLYVEPSGETFPCYAYHRPHAFLGNVFRQGLDSVLDSEPFRDLALHTVDTNPGCMRCEYRYLCGGACRAWSGEAAQYDLDAPPMDCAGLKRRAVSIHEAAVGLLELKLD